MGKLNWYARRYAIAHAKWHKHIHDNELNGTVSSTEKELHSAMSETRSRLLNYVESNPEELDLDNM